jgi:hypothetical protein
LAHAMTKAEKPCSSCLQAWDPEEWYSLTQSGLAAQEPMVLLTRVLESKNWKMWNPEVQWQKSRMSNSRRERPIISSSFGFFVPSRPTSWLDDTNPQLGQIFELSIPTPCQSPPETLWQAHQGEPKHLNQTPKHLF